MFLNDMIYDVFRVYLFC